MTPLPNTVIASDGLSSNSVTLVIVNWNGKEFLQRCLDELQTQTLVPKKILVVDNASTDGSTEEITFASNVTLLRSNSNLGFAGGNNYAFGHIDTEFVALLNPDAFPNRDWLENLVTAANAHPEAAAFGSRQLDQSNSEYLDGIGDNYHITGLVWRERHGCRQKSTDLKQREIFSPCAAAALYRRQAVIDVGGFDEDYFCYIEDVDLGFRLRLADHRSMYVPDAVVHHVGSAATGGQHSDFCVYHGHRNLVWTFIKNMPGALFWLLLPLHVMMNFATIVWFTLRGQAGVILKAKWDAIKGIPQAWRKRRQIQAHRVASISDIWRVLDKRFIPARLIRFK